MINEMAVGKSPLLIFDGVCNLCNASVQWVLTHDKKEIYQFTSMQSPLGQAILAEKGVLQSNMDTVVLLENDVIYTHSDVPLRVLKSLGLPWTLGYIFIMVPKFIRDTIYRWVAANRYRWFGKSESCMLPRPEWKHRFV